MIFAANFYNIIVQSSCFGCIRTQRKETVPAINVDVISNRANAMRWIQITIAIYRMIGSPLGFRKSFVTKLSTNAAITISQFYTTQVMLITCLQMHQLTKHTDLSQPGQYACKEQLTIVGPKGRIERVRVLGPTRKITQVEIAMTEQYRLGVHPPIRESGDIKDTPGCTLEGPAGSVKLDRGVICALRHVHMTPVDALRYGVRDKSVVRVRIEGDRELVFGDVLVRVDPNFALAMHIDTDEANAANVKTGAQGYIEDIQQEA